MSRNQAKVEKLYNSLSELVGNLLSSKQIVLDKDGLHNSLTYCYLEQCQEHKIGMKSIEDSSLIAG